jgi:hypothetical protein
MSGKKMPTNNSESAGKLKADLSEAKRLFSEGFHLVPLHSMSKRPFGNGWNSPEKRVREINPAATGYGFHLASNNRVSVDPDHMEYAVIGMMALGIDLRKIMEAGARTKSTRPNSGGRSMFAADGDLTRVVFSVTRTDKDGNSQSVTALELRAGDENLQDVIPGISYYSENMRGERTAGPFTQEYCGRYKYDDAPPMPDELFEFWERCCDDIEFKQHAQAQFADALSEYFKGQDLRFDSHRSVSTGRKNGETKLGFRPKTPGLAMRFNAAHRVEDILLSSGQYHQDPKTKRYTYNGATGAPGIAPIPGKDDLWASHHAGDPLSGIFDAWTAFVTLTHNKDAGAAEVAAKAMNLPDDYRAKVGAPIDIPVMDDGYNALSEPMVKVVPEFLRFVPTIPAVIKNPEFILDGIIQAGFVLLAGSTFAGKTSQLVPLAMRAAWLCRNDDPLRPTLRRRVIYIAEDEEQVQRIIVSMKAAGELDQFTDAEISDFFKILPARRWAASTIASAGKVWEQFTFCNASTQTGLIYDAKPLIVLDTRSATLSIENENDNSEAAEIIATLRKGLDGFPVIVVGHLAKVLKRSDVKDLSGRGAGAWEADVQQVLYLVKDEETGRRWLEVAGCKHRFAARLDGISFGSANASIRGQNELGEEVTIEVVHGVPEGVEIGQRAQKQREIEIQREDEERARKELAELHAELGMQQAVIDVVGGWDHKVSATNGQFCNIRNVTERVKGARSARQDAVNRLVGEFRIVIRAMPAEVRKAVNRRADQADVLFVVMKSEVVEVAQGITPESLRQRISAAWDAIVEGAETADSSAPRNDGKLS